MKKISFKNTIKKITRWGLPMLLLLQLFFITEVSAYQSSNKTWDGYFGAGSSQWNMPMHWMDPAWMMGGIDNPEVRDFFYRMHREMGPWAYPVMGIVVLGLLLLVILGLGIGIVITILIIFLVIKVLQYTARSGNEQDPTLEAEKIGVSVYYLYLASILLSFLSIAGVIIAYIYQGKATEWVKSHYRYQIRTFWIALLYSIISSILTMVFIGFIGYAFILIWGIIRSVKGIKAYNRKEAIAKPETWLW